MIEFSHQANNHYQEVDHFMTKLHDTLHNTAFNIEIKNTSIRPVVDNLKSELEDLKKGYDRLINKMQQEMRTAMEVNCLDIGQALGVTGSSSKNQNVESDRKMRAYQSQIQKKNIEIQVLRKKTSQNPEIAGDLTRDRAVACATTLFVESLSYLLGADRATLFVHQPESEMLQAVVLINSPEFVPRQIAVPQNKGLAGAVFSSGCALNVHATYAGQNLKQLRDSCNVKLRVQNMLCFPVYDVTGRRVIGCIQFLNKMKGDVNFNDEDEVTVVSSLKQLGYLMQRYKVDLSKTVFPTDSLHRIIPYSDRCDLTPILEGMNEFSDVMNYKPKQLIFRSKTSGHFMRYSQLVKASPVSLGQTSLVEVDGYMKGLEDCWKKTTDEWIAMESDQDGARHEAKRRRRKLKNTEEALSKSQDERNQYRMAFGLLKEEFRSFLDTNNNSSLSSPSPPPKKTLLLPFLRRHQTTATAS